MELNSGSGMGGCGSGEPGGSGIPDAEEVPEYFLADRAGIAVDVPLVVEACRALCRNRATYLAGRTTEQMIRVLAHLAECWLDDAFPFRKRVLELAARETPYPVEVFRCGIDRFFRGMDTSAIRRLVERDLGDERILDEWVECGRRSGVLRRARGTELLVHDGAGALPIDLVRRMFLGFLTRSAQFVFCRPEDAFFPVWVARSIYELEPKLASCLEVGAWPADTTVLEGVRQALWNESDAVVMSAGPEALADGRLKCPDRVRWVGCPPRVSFAFVAEESLGGGRFDETVAAAVRAVTGWNQAGSGAPHVIYVEGRDIERPHRFAEAMGTALDEVEAEMPRGPLRPGHEADIERRRQVFGIRAERLEGTEMRVSSGGTDWTLVSDVDPIFQPSCGGRFVHVKLAHSLTDALRAADRVVGGVSTVGVASSAGRFRELADELAAWGVRRVCSLGGMGDPVFGWDDAMSLADLVWVVHCEVDD